MTGLRPSSGGDWLRLAERAQVIALGIDLSRRPTAHPVRGRFEDRVAAET
jgi:hypothetical protein